MKKITPYIFGILILLAIFIWAEVAKSPSADELGARIYFLDVGQGDSILIEKGNDQVLVDGGPDDKVLSEIGKVMPARDRRIETVILTHPHADHLAGINQVLDRYDIGTIYYSGVSYESSGYSEFIDKVKQKNIKTEIPEINDQIMPFTDAKVTFLWPGKQYQDKTIKNLNNSSVVAQFCFQFQCALLTGDLETDTQKEMFMLLDQKKIDIKSKILKIPHHGSSNGTDQTLLDRVQPEVAVISVGVKNQYGHPHASTIDLLNLTKIKIYRTDLDKTVKFSF